MGVSHVLNITCVSMDPLPKSMWPGIPELLHETSEAVASCHGSPACCVWKSLPVNSKPEVNSEVGHLGKEVVTLKCTYQNLCSLELMVMAREEQAGRLGGGGPTLNSATGCK